MAAEAKVLTIPSKAQEISQAALELYKRTERDRDALTAALEGMADSIRERLEAGAEVEPGLFRAFLKTTERRNVAWKEIVERELGEGYASNVLSHTKATTYTRLIVEA